MIRSMIRDPIRDPIHDPIRDPIRDPVRDPVCKLKSFKDILEITQGHLGHVESFWVIIGHFRSF